VTEPLCTACVERPAHEGYLCEQCTRTLEKILAELPAQLDELQTTINRQANAGRRDNGSHTKAASQPLPIDLRAGHLLDMARNGLSTWIRHLCESRGITEIPNLHERAVTTRVAVIGPVHPACLHESCRDFRIERTPAVTTAGLAVWLTANIEAIRQDELAGEMYAAMVQLQRALNQAVDNHGKRYAGLCTELVTVAVDVTPGPVAVVVPELVDQPQVCNQPLYTRPGAKVIRCSARDDETGELLGCGKEYRASERMRWALEQSEELLESAQFIAHALTDAGYHVTAGQIRGMDKRGRLFAWREDGEGKPLYRVGDVVDLLREKTKESRMTA
jgi:hypothetical protein